MARRPWRPLSDVASGPAGTETYRGGVCGAVAVSGPDCSGVADSLKHARAVQPGGGLRGGGAPHVRRAWGGQVGATPPRGVRGAEGTSGPRAARRSRPTRRSFLCPHVGRRPPAGRSAVVRTAPR